jgi:D-aminoacyl-tRNA deacylase
LRALLQRVSSAKVVVADKITGEIGTGLLILLAVTHTDSMPEVQVLAAKVAELRIFEDAEGKMNLSLEQIAGQALVVSQFTLYADTRRGRRPSFTEAAPPQQATELYEAFTEALRQRNITVATGRFGAKMQVHLVNDGPVTILLDSASQ